MLNYRCGMCDLSFSLGIHYPTSHISYLTSSLKITFDKIHQVIECAMEKTEHISGSELDALLEADKMARRNAERFIRRLH